MQINRWENEGGALTEEIRAIKDKGSFWKSWWKL